MKRNVHDAKRMDGHFRLVIESAPHPILVVSSKGKILFLNSQACRCFGYKSKELMGQPIEDLIPERFRQSHPAQCQGFFANPQVRALGMGRDLFALRKDGSEFPAEIGLSPFKGSEGWVAIAAVLDITVRKKTAAALKAKTELLQSVNRSLASLLENGDWQVAGQWILESAMDQTGSEFGMVGALNEEAILQILAQIYPSGTLAAHSEFKQLEATDLDNFLGRVFHQGQTIRTNDPQQDSRFKDLPPELSQLKSFLGIPILRGARVLGMIWLANREGGYSEREQEILDSYSQALGFLFKIYFHEEREKELQEQLRQSQKVEAIGLLAGGIAHDFNNIITAITGYSDFLLAEMAPEDPKRNDVTEIQKAGERAASLVRQLLAFSRKQVLRPKVVDLNKIIKELTMMLRRIMGEDIQISTAHLEPHLPMIRVDTGQIEQVIMNLAVNSRDAMPRGGQFILKTSSVNWLEDSITPYPFFKRGSYVCLTIEDTGCGMDKQTQAKIFDPFFTTKADKKGTGLGLSTVYGIVKQSEGYILAEAEPGKGTTFNIYFPQVNAELEEEKNIIHRGSPPRDNKTILLVEDEDMVRNLVKTVIQRNGYKVLPAKDGEEALRIWQDYQKPIDLILTDIVMPGMDGKEVAVKIKKQYPKIKILFMSGYSDEAVKKHGFLEPGSAFIQKPFSPEQIIWKIHDLLHESSGKIGN